MAIAALGMFCASCSTIRETLPARTATEQLLLSTAADHAMASTNTTLSEFAHKKVFLDATYFEGYDSKYAIGTVRDALSSAGALLMADAKEADVIIELRSGAFSTDETKYLIGIPSFSIPSLLGPPVPVPEIPFYKSHKDESIAKFALLAYDAHSREHLYSSGSVVGRAHVKKWSLLFFGKTSTDIPEKQKPKKK